MSSWNIGTNDISEETQILKNKLSSKDGHIAAQETQLMKQTVELEEMKSALNDALHKLSRETDHALRLETDLKQCSEDLRNERIVSQNAEAALAAAHEKIRSKDLETKDFQSTLESLSRKSDDASARTAKLEHDKSILEDRVRELQANLHELSSPPVTPGRHRVPRPRSSSLSNFRITTLEQELNDVRTSLSDREADLRVTTEKLARTQGELMKADNEKLAMEKRLKAQLDELHASLEDKDEELEYLRLQQGDGTREEELLRRIEEDAAKIAALEKLHGDSREMYMMQERWQRAEEKLRIAAENASESDRRQAELVREKEEALNELQDTSEQLGRLEEIVNSRETHLDALDGNEQHDANSEALYHGETMLTPQALPDEMDVTYIERLLSAIERLRGERDDLRRDVQFLESESRFTVEALEEKIASLSNPAMAHDLGSDTAMDVFDWPLQVVEVEDQIGRLGLDATTSAVVIGHLRSQADVFASRFRDISLRLEDREEELQGLEERYRALDTNLEVTLQCLAETTSQVTQLESQNGEWAEEVEKVKHAHEETRDHLERAEVQLADISKSLEEVESERDSLTLQVTNLTTDVYSAQQELADAENRYRFLQFHQLSNMSSNEATRALRDQIEELEMRVMRRTEQIGAHQQDIKRLETNLRLQEERLEEMTGELEMMAAQKEAMVEDCATAREARDEAIVRVEGLELDMEALEGQLEKRDETILALVHVMMQTVSRSRDMVRVSNQRTNQVKDELSRLTAEHEAIVRLLEQQTSAIPKLTTCSEIPGETVQETALEVVDSEIEPEKEKSMFPSQTFDETSIGLEDKVKMLLERLETELAETKSLAEQLKTLRCKAATSEDVETELHDLQQAFSSRDTTHSRTIDEVIRAKERFQLRLKARNDEERPGDQLGLGHVEELQACLDQALSELEDARNRCAKSEASHKETLSEFAQSKQELESHLKALFDSSLQSEQLRRELTRIKVEHAEEVIRLEEQLDTATSDARKAKQSHDELQVVHQGVVDELVLTKDSFDRRLKQATEQLEDNVNQLGLELAELSQKFQDSVQGIDQLERRLQEEADNLAQEQESHRKALHVASERYQLAESHQTQLRKEISSAQVRLEQNRVQLELLQEEKTALQVEMTTLEAEGQRSISLCRFLESKVKEHECTITALEDALQRSRADFCRSETLGKAAEVNLSLQSAQHKREMADLRREIYNLRSRPNLETVVAELEERNNEMEDILRMKCTEIEANDDRALEMLKENKKLTTKVESLTRKVHNLQTKLTAAKAAMPKATTEVVDTAPRLSNTSTPIPSLPSSARPRARTLTTPVPSTARHAPSTPVVHTPLKRMVSGPSSLPRPKTPERRTAPLPVFKARTPERPMAPVIIADPSSAVGKKRRAPDDFDFIVPPQGFTVDSVPGDRAENTTPRVRKVLNSIHSGFTPMRHHNMRPTTSPKRVEVASTKPSFMSDVTNSPHAISQTVPQKPSKRSWLGKIRGTSSQTMGRTPVSSRPVFDGEPS